MSKKKSSTTQNQTQNQSYNNASTNTYGWQNTPDTADISKFRDFNPQVDPGLGAQYGAAHERLNSSFINPLGGASSPQIRDAQMRTGNRQLNQDEASAFRSGQYDVNQQKGSQLSTLAALTSPRLVQQGSTSSGTGTGTSSGTGTSVESGDLLGQILGGASQVGSAALLTLMLCFGLYVYSKTLDRRHVVCLVLDRPEAYAAKSFEPKRDSTCDNLDHRSCEV